MRRQLRVAVLVALALGAGPFPAARAQDPVGSPVARQLPAEASSQTVQPGDVLKITVFRNPELSGDIVVADDGSLQHPLYRDVRVAGLTRPEVQARIRQVLLRYETEPQFVVEPLSRVSVLGEVRNPNLYAVLGTTTVAQAVAMAGGTTDRANGKAVLIRGGQRIAIDLRRPTTGAAALSVQSRDEVVVERGRRAVLGASVGMAAAVAAAVASLYVAFNRN